MEKEELLKISEIADFFGTTPKALRIYEQKGIIIPCKIDPESGYRYYSADQVKNALISSIDSLLERRKDFLTNPSSDFTRVKKICFPLFPRSVRQE